MVAPHWICEASEEMGRRWMLDFFLNLGVLDLKMLSICESHLAS
jgi:hypothetical protein